jgi:Ras-related protein Rab-7A
VEEGYEHEYPVIVVANKTDLTRAGPGNPTPHEPIPDEEIQKFLLELIPVPSSSGASAEGVGEPDGLPDPAPLLVDEPQPTQNGNGDSNAGNGHPFPSTRGGGDPDTSRERTTSISIVARPNSRRDDSRASQTRQGGTMGTTRTIYHTASSSLLDSDAPTPSRPPVAGFNWSPPASSSLGTSYGAGTPSSRRRQASTTTTHSSATVTLGMYRTLSHQSQGQSAALSPQPTNIDVESTSNPNPAPKPHPDQGAHLLYASARTGEGLAEIFEYTARRVVQKVEWEEEEDQRAFGVVEPGQSSRIMLNGRGTQDGRKARKWGRCC